MSAVVGFYSADGKVDDVWWIQRNGLVVEGFSLPGITGSPFLDDFPFDAVTRVVDSPGAADGTTVLGGVVAGTPAVSIPAGTTTAIAFVVGDEADGVDDSILIVDGVVCPTDLIFASAFEATVPSRLFAWDATVGLLP
jgi:hypothetical protein